MDFHSHQELIETPGGSLEPSTGPSRGGVPGRRAAGLLSRQLQRAWGFPSSSPPHPAAGCSNIPAPGHLRLLWLLSKAPQLGPRRGSGHPPPSAAKLGCQLWGFPRSVGAAGKLWGWEAAGAWRNAERLSRGRTAASLPWGLWNCRGHLPKRAPGERGSGGLRAPCPSPKGRAGLGQLPLILGAGQPGFGELGRAPGVPTEGVPPPGPSCSPSCCVPRGSSAWCPWRGAESRAPTLPASPFVPHPRLTLSPFPAQILPRALSCAVLLLLLLAVLGRGKRCSIARILRQYRAVIFHEIQNLVSRRVLAGCSPCFLSLLILFYFCRKT